MRRLSLRRSGGPDGLLAAAGLGLGFALAFAARSLLEGVNGRRLRHLVSRLRGEPPAPSVRTAARRIEEALDGADEFRDAGLEVVPVRPGHVELHGWVESRPSGGRALRLATAAAPDTEVVSRLRVRGEDDALPPQEPAEERQPA